MTGKDFIDREAALVSLNKSMNLNEMRERLKRLCAADVREVVRGEWVVSRTDFGWNCSEFPTHCKCTQCGREIPYQERDNFCPKCGADMRGTKDES